MCWGLPHLHSKSDVTESSKLLLLFMALVKKMISLFLSCIGEVRSKGWSSQQELEAGHSLISNPLGEHSIRTSAKNGLFGPPPPPLYAFASSKARPPPI